MTFHEAKEIVSRMNFGPTFQFTLEMDPHSHQSLATFTVHEWVLDAVSAPFATRSDYIRIPPSAWKRESYYWKFGVWDLHVAKDEDDFFGRCEDVFIRMRSEKIRTKFVLDPKPEPQFFVEYFVNEAVL